MSARWRLSMSRMGLAETCPPSCVIPSAFDVTPNVYRDRGTALHAYLCNVTEKGHAAALALVPEAFVEDAKAIDLDALPHAEAGAWAVEVAYAYNPEKDVARELHRGGTRDYSMVLDDELPGTADLIGLTPTEVVVLDVKTGRKDLERPEDAMQLLSLAVAASRAHHRKAARIGWIRLADGVPRFSWAVLDESRLAAAQERVRQVWDAVLVAEIQNSTVGPDTLQYTRGDHCRFCPAIDRCPAQVALVREASALIGQSEAPLSIPHAQLGALWNWKEALQAVADRIEAYIEQRIEAEGAAPMPDGKKVLGQKVTKKEFVNGTLAQEVLAEVAPELLNDAVALETKVSVSKSSILDAIRKQPLAPGQTLTKRRDEVVDVLRRRGALYETSHTSVAVHVPKAVAP